MANAKVVVDGSGDRAFKREFRSYLRRHVAAGSMSSIELKDSRRDRLLQLADLVTGAIARSYRQERADADRWRKMLEAGDHIEDVWEFK